MILMDTDICIGILRGNKKILQKRKDYNGEIAVSFMTIAELFYGAQKSNNLEWNKILIEKFLVSIIIFHSDLDILIKFGELKERLEQKGKILPDADLFIAATAILRCNRLITGNTKHFNRFDELKIENWI